jgi:hypothetical protein
MRLLRFSAYSLIPKLETLKSGGQICWQEASQTYICWLFLEVSCQEIGMRVRSALYWELRHWISSLTDGMCRSRRRTAYGTYQGASVIRKTFDWNLEDFDVRGGGRAPKLQTIGPIVAEEFVACSEPRLASQQPVHFGERGVDLFPFSEDVVVPGK